MDNDRSQVIPAGAAGADADEDRRVEELLRVNARLAAEVRSLTLGRTGAPRSAAMPTSRRIGTLIDERDTLTKQLAEAQNAVEAGRAHREDLERDNAELAAAVTRLRSGPRGILRRLFARLRGPAA